MFAQLRHGDQSPAQFSPSFLHLASIFQEIIHQLSLEQLMENTGEIKGSSSTAVSEVRKFIFSLMLWVFLTTVGTTLSIILRHFSNIVISTFYLFLSLTVLTDTSSLLIVSKLSNSFQQPPKPRIVGDKTLSFLSFKVLIKKPPLLSFYSMVINDFCICR